MRARNDSHWQSLARTIGQGPEGVRGSEGECHAHRSVRHTSQAIFGHMNDIMYRIQRQCCLQVTMWTRDPKAYRIYMALPLPCLGSQPMVGTWVPKVGHLQCSFWGCSLSPSSFYIVLLSLFSSLTSPISCFGTGWEGACPSRGRRGSVGSPVPFMPICRECCCAAQHVHQQTVQQSLQPLP